MPTLGRPNIATPRRVSDREIDRTSPEELSDLLDNFWDKAVPLLPSVIVFARSLIFGVGGSETKFSTKEHEDVYQEAVDDWGDDAHAGV